jgi:transcriptional regulator with XRE-family HTH domain
MKPSETELVFESLKKIMKSKGFTYKSLAQELQVAESTLKRIFSQKNCSLDKLMSICDVVGVSFSDLVSLYENNKLPVIKIDKELEKFFLDQPEYFKFYRQFTLYKSAKIVQEKNQLTEKCVSLYCEKLSQLGLLKLNKKKEYELSEEGFVQFSKLTKLQSKIFNDWSRHLLDHALNKEPHYLYKAASTRLTKKSSEEFKQQVAILFEKFTQKGYLENIAANKKVEPVGVFMVSGPEIINFPGKVKNIK